MITTAKIAGDGLSINHGGLWLANSHPEVVRWLEGRTYEWLQLELTFVAETHAHANWVDTTTYDERLVQYELDVMAFDSWDGIDNQPEEPVYPVKPVSYYTAEEVCSSVLLHDSWLVDEANFTAEDNTLVYPIPEPALLNLPSDLVEPTIASLPEPTPNIPESEFTEAELTANAENEARSIRNSALTECDWTQNRDVVLANDGEWQVYRQALRDVTSDIGWMTDPINTISLVIINKPS